MNQVPRHPISPATREATRLLGLSVREGRVLRRWTVRELAERLGVSHVTVSRVERGEPSVSLGVALEAATLVGVPLFHPTPEMRALEARRLRERLALLPQAVRPRQVDDDF